MHISVDPIQTLQRDVQILLHHLQDRKQNLRFENANRNTILESIDDGLVVLDEEDVIRYTNQRLRIMLGSPDWEGRHFSKLYSYLLDQKLHQEQNHVSLQTVYHAVVGKRNLVADDCEMVWDRPATKYVRAYTGPISHNSQIYMGRVWKFEDISKQKELEQMKVEMVSLATHQLRTPLTAIRGYLKMIESGDYGDLPENFQKPVSVLMHSTEKMRDLINDLLDVSRLDSGKAAPKHEKVELISTLQEEVDAVQSLVIQKGIELNFVSVLPELIIETDPKLIKEMFKNYLSNAVKYTPEGKQVNVMIIYADSTSMKVIVQDQGIGIPPAAHQFLFQKFYRADNAQSAGIEGTGLGLYYVKKCAEILGGKVGFKSIQNVGSEFWFTLPLISTNLLD